VTYIVEAIVASTRVAQMLADQFDSARSVSLRAGLALVPLTDQLKNEVAGVEPSQTLLLDEQQAQEALAAFLANASRVEPVAYLDAVIWGGAGVQRSAVWRDGQLVLGPIKSVFGTPWWPVDDIDDPSGPGAFNEALRQLVGAVVRLHAELTECLVERARPGWVVDVVDWPPRRSKD